MNRTGLSEKPAERGRPTWGFCRVQVLTVCRLWSAYRAKQLKRQDVQTWFAAHELLMRRCTLRFGRKPLFCVQELESLTDIRAGSLRASIRRLEARGFLSWSEHELCIKDGSEQEQRGLTDMPAMTSAVTNHRRTLPIPRHTVLLLARTRRPVVLATILGHLFRGMYYRSGECLSWGTCKASWIAETFGVDVRNVKAARGELMKSGWMRQVESHHWHRQRYGGSFIVSLGWSASGRRNSPPRRAPGTAKTPPPESDRNLPKGIKNQKRDRARGSGVQGRNKVGTEPRLTDVHPEDLTDPHRTDLLFRQAVRAGFVQNSPHERLRVFAAAERSKRKAKNPGGFFVTILRKGLWQNIANRDEEQGRRELTRLDDFDPVPWKPEKVHQNSAFRGPPPVQPISSDAESAEIRELIRASLASVTANNFPPPTSY